MPQWILASCRGNGAEPYSATQSVWWYPLYGLWKALNPETNANAIARDTYTLSELFVRVIANDANIDCTLRTRKNGGNGNQSVLIPSTATGTFQDTVNTDSLVNGNLFCYHVGPGGGTGTIAFTIVSCLLETASNTTPIIGMGFTSRSSAASVTIYTSIMGGSPMWIADTESHVQYIFRVAATLSNLRVCGENYKLSSATVRTRVNGANGNQSISIPTDTTGQYEDAVNSDSISIGDEVNIAHVRGSATGGACNLYIYNECMKSNAAGRQTACAWNGSISNAIVQDYNVTYYYTIEGSTREVTSTELNTQCLTRAAFVAGNFFVNVPANTTNGTRIVNTRINGGDGSLSVSIGASATGTFEDLVNSDTLIATDLYNFKSGTGGSSGSIVIQIVGVQIPYQEATAGLENKSANMGSKMVAAGLI